MTQDLDMGSELPDARAQASTIPTMAAAIPCGAGQSPQHGQRRHNSSAEESARQTDTRVSSTQRVPERAATSQADLSPTMAEAIPARAGQSPFRCNPKPQEEAERALQRFRQYCCKLGGYQEQLHEVA